MSLRRDGSYQPAHDEPTPYRVIDAAATDKGDLYFLDVGSSSIYALDWQLRFISEIAGSRGAGPGDFGIGGRITALPSGPCYGYADRVNCWDRRGRLRRAARLPNVRSIYWLGHNADGGLIFLASAGGAADGIRERVTIGHVNGADGSFATVADFTRLPAIWVRRPGAVWNTMLAVSEPAVVVGGANTYVTPGEEYQIFAYRGSNELVWATRTAWRRFAVNDEIVSEAVDRLRRRQIYVGPEDFDVPNFFPALTSPTYRSDRVGYGHALRVDGHGHLYVFPLIAEERIRTLDGEDIEWRPVDVYTPDGARVFTGLVTSTSWLAAWGDFVYGVELEPDSGEQQFVRYRLFEPF